MAVVAGVVFFAVRALLALIPPLAAGFPIKKWSAAAALAAAAFYLLLSGAEVATQRSFFMTAVVLIAVMVDRRAVTFRTLAVVAIVADLVVDRPFFFRHSSEMALKFLLHRRGECRSGSDVRPLLPIAIHVPAEIFHPCSAATLPPRQ
jgi:hypothetical protein